MLFASWNVNGIRAIQRKGLLIPFIDHVKPDIICFQETKAEEHQSEVDIEGYDEFWNSSKTRKGYSGTAIFTKIKPLRLIFDFPENILEKYHLADGYGDPNTEGRIITAEFENFFLVNTYTPNAKPDLSRLQLRHTQWDPAFLEFCKDLERNKPIIFCGDLNVAHKPEDLAHPEANEGEHGFTKEEREGIDAIVRAGFVDTFRLFAKGKGYYTWWSHFSNARARNIGWRIDYFFVSGALVPKVQTSRIHPDFYGSDHCPISLELELDL